MPQKRRQTDVADEQEPEFSKVVLLSGPPGEKTFTPTKGWQKAMRKTMLEQLGVGGDRQAYRCSEITIAYITMACYLIYVSNASFWSSRRRQDYAGTCHCPACWFQAYGAQCQVRLDFIGDMLLVTWQSAQACWAIRAPS